MALKNIGSVCSMSFLLILTVTLSIFADENSPQDFAYMQLAFPEGVSIHQLDNGMQILLIENPALPMVGVNVVVKVGSAYETFASSGMSHMLEHLLFNGTTKRTQKQLYDDVDRIGGYNNANTSEFYTNFMMVTPAEFIKTGMEIQADMLFNSTLPPEKFEKEKGIVLEEISKSLADVNDQVERNTASILFSGHALSLPTLGTYSTIEHMTRDDVYAFYKNNYVPNNMILSAVGNFDSEKMLQEIRAIYGSAAPALVKRESNSAMGIGVNASSIDWPQANQPYHRFYGGDKSMVQLYFPVDGSEQFFEFVDMTMVQEGPRLQLALKEAFPDKIASLSFTSRPSALAGYVQATIDFAAEINDAAVHEAIRQISQVEFGLSPKVVQAEVARRRTAFLKNIEKPHMFGIYNANTFAVSGIEAVLASYSGENYNAAAQELSNFRLDNSPVVIIQHPQVKSRATAAPDLNAMFFDDVPGRPLIVAQNPAGNLLAIHFLVKHKAMYESKHGADAARILHDCLEQRLDSEINKTQSSQFGLTFTVNDNPYIPMDDIYLHPDFSYIRVEGLADDVSGAVRYITDQIKNFAPTEPEFNLAVEKFKRSSPMMNRGDATKKIFDQTWEDLIYAASPYETGKTDFTFADLSVFAGEYFRPSNMIISVVSPEQPQRINELFADFQSPAVEEPPIYARPLRLPEQSRQEEIEASGERAYLFWGFVKNVKAEDAAALQALSLVLSDVITFDIREKQGMAYQISAGVNVVGDKALFYINQGTRPQNVDHLLSEYPKFFQQKILDSISAEDLEKSINMYLGRLMFRRLSSINRAYYLAHSLYFQGEIRHDEIFINDLKHVNLADVKRAAKQYLKVENPIEVVARKK